MPTKFKDIIKELEERHRVIADNLLDAIWVINAETLKYEYITPSIEKVSGYTVEEHMQLSVQDRLTPQSFQQVAKVLAEETPRFNKGVKKIKTMELELIHKNGTTYWAEIRAKFIKDKDKPLKIIGITREISERKKNETQQKELIQKLSNALAEKKKLLKTVETLRGLLPICSGCKRIRDENEKWWPLDAYVRKRMKTEITHTICPDCTDVFYGDQ